MINKILVAVDYSEGSRAAIERAAALARAVHAELVLVHAIEVPVLPAADPSLMPVYAIEEREKSARERFAQLLRSVQADVPARGLVEVGPVHEVVREAIAREEPDLLVVGTHGRRGLGRWVLGSVTERLLRTSPTPVLTVRVAPQTVEGSAPG